MNNKILVISNMYPTEKHKSFGIFVKNQVEQLKSLGLDVVVIANNNPKKGKVNLIRKYGQWSWRFLLHLLLQGRKTSVVHAHYVFPSGLLALIHKKLYGTRFIVTAHGGDIDKMARKNSTLRSLTMKILKEADHVIAVGDELYDTIVKEFHVKESKVSIINMGVNLSVFKPLEKDEARKACRIGPNVTPLLFVGNVIEQKGLTELVRAFSELKKIKPEVELFILGSQNDQGYKNKLDELISSFSLDESIHFLGTKNQLEVATWMAAAEVFVLPSHIEGFGLVAVEAMACGTPVVGTRVGGLKYLLAENHGVLAEPKNAESLHCALVEVLSSNELRTLLINNGLTKAKENDQVTMTNKVVSLYQPDGKQDKLRGH